jgi:hypothetical protein
MSAPSLAAPAVRGLLAGRSSKVAVALVRAEHSEALS